MAANYSNRFPSAVPLGSLAERNRNSLVCLRACTIVLVAQQISSYMTGNGPYTIEHETSFSYVCLTTSVSAWASQGVGYMSYLLL